jgi:hypothetical protein
MKGLTMFKPNLTYKQFVSALTKGIEDSLDMYEQGWTYVEGDKVEFESSGIKIQHAAKVKKLTANKFEKYPTEYNYLALRVAEEVYEILCD